MTDFCLQTATEADMDKALLAAGIIDADGAQASPQILLDRLPSPLVMPDGTVYDGYYVNLRFYGVEPTKEQSAIIDPLALDPSQPQYRVWM